MACPICLSVDGACGHECEELPEPTTRTCSDRLWTKRGTRNAMQQVLYRPHVGSTQKPAGMRTIRLAGIGVNNVH